MVVFPDPLGPTNPMIFPCRYLQSEVEHAGVFGKLLLQVLGANYRFGWHGSRIPIVTSFKTVTA